MTAAVLSMPADPDAVPGWLDRQLVGPGLGRLVAELAAVHGPAAGPERLAAVLGGRRAGVLAGGLAALPRPALSRLLRQPDLLVELQELVLAEGGPYWDAVGGDGPALTAAAGRVAARVREAVAGGPSPEPAGRRWNLRSAAAGFAVAAGVFLAVYAVDPAGDRRPEVAQRAGPPPAADAGSAPAGAPPTPPPAGVAWGWASGTGLPAAGDDAAVLRHLRDKAGEWFKKRPADPPALAQRLGEFRQGCSALLLATNLPLSAGERAWLAGRCRGWAGEFDGHLRALEASRDAVAVRAAADATATKIVRELDERAAAAGRG